jgi:hypothetical protein
VLLLNEMRARITFRCTNDKCAGYEKDVDVPTDKPLLLPEWCKICPIGRGTITITAGAERYQSIDAYATAMRGKADKRGLLQRLVDAGVATDDDREQLRSCDEYLTDATCPCCMQAFNPTQ